MGKEQRRLALCATSLVFLLLLSCLYAAFFSPNSIPFGSWKQKLSNWKGIRGQKADESIEISDSLEFQFRRLVRGDDRIQLDATGFSCHSDLHSEVCLVKKPVRIDINASKVHIPFSKSHINRTVRPYANRDDATAMNGVSPVQIVNGDKNLRTCDFTHDVPAVVFSSGGFTGNLFHEINEIIIPLFITCRHFRSQLKFVITDYTPWWVSKYSKILTHLSHYEVINPAANVSVHCFPGAVIGLKYHGNLALNGTHIPGGYSMFDFRHFLRRSYNLKIKHVSEIKSKKPVLILISRVKSRVFLNEDEMVIMMEGLGFQVIVTRPDKISYLNKFTEVVNSCSVLVGAHGAGLANELFLPAGAVTVQVVPLGLEWASTNYFGAPAREMGLQYLEYKIEPEESSLMQTYGKDHPVIDDPASVLSKGYYAFRAVYVDGQNLKINVTRFRETIVQATQLIGMSNPLN